MQNENNAAVDAYAQELAPELLELPISRRSLLQAGLAGATGFWLTDHLRQPAQAAAARSQGEGGHPDLDVGGPPHNDTFDPKPQAGYDYCGPLSKTAPTNVPGTQIGELLPELAKMADKYSIIRSMTHGQNGHETASYMTQTGHPAGGQAGLSECRRHRLEVQGRRCRLRGSDSALHRARRSPRAGSRKRVSWAPSTSRLPPAAIPAGLGLRSKGLLPRGFRTSGSERDATCWGI